MPRFTLGLLALLLLLTPHAAAQSAADYDALVAKMYDYGLLHGAVLVAEDGEVVYQSAVGQADRAWGIPNTPDTRFRIASVTKQFTAAFVLQLVEEGKVHLDGVLTDYLPDYPAAQGARVTVRQLLNHTSGIPSMTGLPDFMTTRARQAYTHEAMLAEFSEMELEFEPGTEHRYNNSGYYLLGVLIEAVTGQPYDEALQERLLTPLGLEDTGYEHNEAVIERMAHGYARSRGHFSNAAFLDTTVPFAAGMMYSTLGDLLRWTEALHAGRPFRRTATLDTMLTPYLSDYAFGLSVGEQTFGEQTVPVVQHSGGIFGFSSQLVHFPDTRRTVVVLDNTAGHSGFVAEVLATVAHGEPAPLIQRPIADAVADVIEAEGVEAAAAEYRRLRAAGDEAYDFREYQLNGLG
jgi:CubicO group peptidase (beta-lactamase class C family)